MSIVNEYDLKWNWTCMLYAVKWQCDGSTALSRFELLKYNHSKVKGNVKDGRRKVTPDMEIEMNRLYHKENLKMSEVAVIMKVSTTAVWNYINNPRNKHTVGAK